ncbi:YkvA family protein [Allopusillimonas ginsengisoli]|uniref:YkvA family protein n=1 Tax=Allopusillimonas ginsengisoli TaxID=453575 RepID=UPI0039C35EB4
MTIAASIKLWAERIKREAVMLWFARNHPETPILAKVLCFFAVAYALSPIDLIPDFIPVLGYIDDALILPAVIWLAVRLLPVHVIEVCRLQAETWLIEQRAKPRSYAGATIIIVVWMFVLYECWRLFIHQQ